MVNWYNLPFTLVTLLLAVTVDGAVSPRSLNALTDDEIAKLVTTTDAVRQLDPSNESGHLFKILIPRAPDTQNNTAVRNHIVTTLKNLNWHVEEDQFTDTTPYGEKSFTNVIATKDPEAPRRVILSAHFDSKFFLNFPENQFVGATDSALPCAVLLDIAEALNAALEARKERLRNNQASEAEQAAAETTLQLVFFDGEEAFRDWTATDSIYGSRHLAQKWSNEYVSPVQSRRQHPRASLITSIDHLILLDLLGAPQPKIHSYFTSTGWLFDGLVTAEARLGQLGHLNEPGASVWQPSSTFFIPRNSYIGGRIEDDHVPFLERGVNILHVIASPFPSVWHTTRDDASALDIPTMKRWNLIFRVFTAEYLQLSASTVTSTAPVERSNDELFDQ